MGDVPALLGMVTELRERNCAILVISHLLFEQQRFDMVYHLQEGKIQEEPQVQLSA